MGAPGWEIHDDELWLIDPDGNRRAPGAEEIYRALVERKPEEDWIPVQLTGLRASRYPLDPVILLSTDARGRPASSVRASAPGVTVRLSERDLLRGYHIAAGVWWPVDAGASRAISEALESAGTTLGHELSLSAYLALARKAGAGVVENSLPTSALDFAPAAIGTPAGVLATLYPYQLSGWRWLQFLMDQDVGGVLADEMGLGKTLQVISILSDCGGAPLGPVLIIAPGSILENWSRELAKFAPHLRVLKHHGPLRTGRPADLEAPQVVVASYDTAVTDSGLLNMIRWKLVVLDEAQFIRNPDAQRTKAVKRLRRDAGLAVTGTPVENKLLDLWSIIDFVMPGHLGDASAFASKFANDPDGAAAIEPLVSPLMLRRKVSEVARDLPARIDIPQFVELDAREARSYDAERARITAEYGAAATLVALGALRQFCAHPTLVVPDDAPSDPMSFSKFRRLDELVEEIFERGEKVLIFTSWTKMADLIARHIGQQHHTFAEIIDGRCAIDERQPLIDRFSEQAGGAALVLNPRAGGAGLNITAANHVIHYNPEWNPALQDQASARAHRRGQTRPVTVHRLLVADTVEDAIDSRLSRKRAISESAVVGIEGDEEDYADIVEALRRSPSIRADA